MLLPRRIDEELGERQQGTVLTDDGAALLYQSFGRGEAVVFANGIGVRYPGAVKQIAALRDRYRVLCWDYRGIGQSVLPKSSRAGLDGRPPPRSESAGAPRGDADLTMPRHARDILAILDALAIERAVFVGWSMGVQVSLEVARRDPGRVAGLVALLGTYGQPFRTAFPAPVSAGLEGLFRLLRARPGVAQGALDLAVTLPGVAFGLLSSLLFVGSDADREVFEANVRSVAGVEKRTYLGTMLALAEHDAADVLPTLSCPSLIICGSRDHLTPPRVARVMAEKIRGAEYREVEGGTHFALIEQPAQINGWLRSFVDRVYG
jgi:pimeloyl-ACP methyl ester carboxylesterase